MEEQKVAIAITFTLTVILTLLPYTICGAYTADDGVDYRDEHCLRSYEVHDKRIIRTEDSLENKSSFVDAVVSDSYENCLRECCKHGPEACDTTVFIESDAGRDENCFIFRCWFDNDEQRCLFSYHEGYKSSMIGGFEAPRFANSETFPILVGDEVQVSKIQSTTVVTTTRTPAAILVPRKTTAVSVQPEYEVEHQQCISTQYQCPESGECIPERLVCDKVDDCRDKSDEKNCDVEDDDDDSASKSPDDDSASKSPDAGGPKTNADKYEPKYEDSILPLSEEESVSYSEDDTTSDSDKYHDLAPEKLPEHPRHQTGDGDHVLSSGAQELLDQQDIQHLRLLADKQKNKNDLLSMRHQAKGAASVPAQEHVQSNQFGLDNDDEDEDVGDQGERCLLGICPPDNDLLENINWPSKSGAQSSVVGQDDDQSQRGEKLEDRIPASRLQFDYPGDVSTEEDHPYDTNPEQQSHSPAVTQETVNNKAAKPHPVGSSDQSGSLPSHPNDDLSEQQYMDRDVAIDKGRTGKNYYPPSLDKERQGTFGPIQRSREDTSRPYVPFRGDNGQRPDIVLDKQIPAHSAPDRSAMKGARFESYPHDSDVGQTSPDHERFTTDQPRNWLPSKDRPISVQSPPVSSDILNQAVMDSEYFEEWPGISLLYDQDSYNVGGDWAGLPGNNWQSDPLPPKGNPQRPDDDGWYNRYGDNQYGYYEPRQRNRGSQRLPSRGRNRFRGGVQQKPQNSGRHKGRNRGGYTNLDEVDTARHYTSANQKDSEEGYPVNSVDAQPPPQPEVVIPDRDSPSTTRLPLPEPTPDAAVDDDVAITNRVTLPYENHPPTNPPPVRYQEEAVIGEAVITEELEGATGAMFPLVVGLLLTLFLLVMVGFRLHYMNRRVRYGRMKTNAHDADYLINGMYL